MADLDRGDIARGKFDFDVTGHYARPDVFRFEVDERPKAPVAYRSDLPDAGPPPPRGAP